MKLQGRTILGAVAVLAALAAIVPATASARPGARAEVWTVHGHGATSAASVNVLTLNDPRGIDNRISVFTGPTGRLTLTAPEGLGDPDGSGAACGLDNAKPGESTAPEVSCAPGFIGAIVGDLGRGTDTFNAPSLPLMIGGEIDGDLRPLEGGPGRDRLVGGGMADLLMGEGGADSMAGGGGQDQLVGGPGADNLSGGGAADLLVGGGGPDKLSGGGGRDVCRGSGAFDTAKSCETARGIP